MAAGGGVIGALRVILGADTAAFETGLKNSGKHLDKFGALAQKAGIAIGASLSLAVVGLGMAIKGTLDEADKLGKMAQSVGVPVEELSRLKHAADLSGVSLESLAKGLGRLNRNLVEGAQGLSTPVKAFEALGISIRNADGSIKTVSEALPEIAEKFSKMRDGPEKTALSMQLLGRAGADLIPMLNLGKAGLQEMMKEAEALGIVIDTKTAKAAEEFNDNLTRLKRVFDGIITQVTAHLAPALAMVSGALVTLAKNSDHAKGFASGLVSVIKGTVEVAYTAAVAFRRLGAELSAVWTLLTAAGGKEHQAAWDNLVAEGKKTEEQLKAIPEVLAKFWKEAEDNAAKFANSSTGNTQVLIQNSEQVKQKLREEKQAAEERNRAFEAMWEEGARLYEQTRTPLEQFSASMEKLNLLYQDGVISSETYSRAVFQLQDSFTGASQFAKQFGDMAFNAFDRIVFGGEKAGDVMKDLLKDMARMAAHKVWTTLLGSMFGMPGGGGGGKGLFGFASGGSFQVGGSGGIDSQLVAFKASPNERVTVTKPGQGMGGGAMAISVNINLEGANGDTTIRQIAQEATAQGVQAGLRAYDQNLPGRLREVNRRGT